MTKKHLWIMLACCLLPVAAVVAVGVFKIPIGTLGLYSLLLLCPMGHFFMMRRMGDKGHHYPVAKPGDTLIEGTKTRDDA